MENHRPQQALLERILSSPHPAVLLTAPAGVGKTAAALEMYGHFEATGHGRCLLLVPNAAASALLRRMMLEASPRGVLVRPAVLSFEDLAGRILSAGRSAPRRLSAFHRRLLLRRIVTDLHEEGKLPTLAAVADTPGLITALDAAIAEIKRAAIEPDTLARAIGRRAGKSADLLAVYRRYQEHLHATETYDLEGLMWKAKDALASPATDLGELGLGGLVAAAVDGFTDFTPTQLSIIRLLSRRMDRLLITLPHSRDGRERMWRWSGRTLANIHRAFGDDLQEVFLDADSGRRPAAAGNGGLRALWEKVFDFDAAAADPPEGLSVIAAFSLESEVVAVARRVKRLLLDGAAAGSVAVLARSMDAYRPTIERVFGECGIPIAASPATLATQPIVRFVFDVASVGPEFASRDVLRVLKNSYFRPEALGPFDAATAAAAEALIRRAGILRGAEAYAQAARRLAERAGRQQAEDDDGDDPSGPVSYSPQQFQAAGEMLQQLFGLWERANKPAPASGTPGRGNPAGLEAIIERLDLRRAACHDSPELTARDLRCLDELEGLLKDLPHPPPAWEVILEALSAVGVPQQRRRGAVDVADVLDARALRYAHVFCLGLGEGQFPARYSESPLIGEDQRLDWAGRGAALDSRSDLTAREMLLFYLAVSRAEDTLTVSFPLWDASGRPGAPGAFLLSLLEPIGGLEGAQRAGIVQHVPPGQMIPPGQETASPREAVIAALAGRFHEEYDPGGGTLAWVARQQPHCLLRVAGGLLADYRRWRAGPCDAFDGRIGDAELAACLAERFGPEAVFSATQLGTFGQCPWQFFARYVLRLQPLEDPQRPPEALYRGLFCHRVLFDTMRRLSGKTDGPVRLAELERSVLLEALDQSIASASAEVEARGVPYPALWRIQRDQMHGQLREYLLDRHGGQVGGGESIHFELDFGLDTPSAQHDPSGKAQPAKIATPAGTMLLGGRIDRVDRVCFENRQGLFVVDYKTGRLPQRIDILEGRSLQLPLYSAAVEALLGQPCFGGAFHRIGSGNQSPATFFAAFQNSKDGLKPAGGFGENRSAVLEKVGRFLQEIRLGHFDLQPARTEHCRSCPYRRICHYADTRAQRKVENVPAVSEAPS